MLRNKLIFYAISHWNLSEKGFFRAVLKNQGDLAQKFFLRKVEEGGSNFF